MKDLSDSLTSEILRQLYVEEGLSETSIARRFNTHQVKIGRLRKKWGIDTLLKSDRRNLPELTPRLRSILVGSMLGDGGMRETGSKTAGYVEHHSVKQKDYLEWKAREWGEYALPLVPSDKGTYKGFRLFTLGSRSLRPFWEMFYPTGKGEKTFIQLPVEWVDDLALAVWFMDDGSRGQTGVRFSISPDPANQKVLLQILARLGIKGSLYTTGDAEIQVHTRISVNRFLARVEPYIHPSLKYKLDFARPKSGLAPRDILTPGRLQPFIDRGIRPQEISELLRVSRSSVVRALDRMGTPRESTGRPSLSTKRELSVKVAEESIRRLDPTSESFEETVLGILSRTEIPLLVPSREQALKDWHRLLESPTVYRETFEGVSAAGSRLCQHFFTYRWDACYRDNPSVRGAWYDLGILRRAVRFQMAVKDPVTPIRVFRALQAVVRAPTNFRPCFAKAVVQRLCPVGGTVLDPCAGYGGRAVGTLSAGRSYVGCDPHPQAPEAYRALGELLQRSLTFHGSPYEDTDLGAFQADLVFTSPPYFSVERYSEDPGQSWVRYRSWEAWKEGFLRNLVRKSWAHLKPGCVFAVNTKNVRVGRQVILIADTLVEYAEQEGFQLEARREIPLGFLGRAQSTEPLFVFRKPSMRSV